MFMIKQRTTMVLTLFYCVIIIFSIKLSFGWDLSSFLGPDDSEAQVKWVTAFKMKAYLSIPRVKRNQAVTLMEAPWPENANANFMLPTSTIVKPFPDKESQLAGDCDCLQSVVSTDIDSFGRLYVLDAGLGRCSPKIVVYDTLLRRKVISSELTGVNHNSVHSLILDGNAVVGSRAYVGDTYCTALIVFSLLERCWWHLPLSKPKELSVYDPERYKLEPQQLALSKVKPDLYVTSDSSDLLFTINLAQLHTLPTPLKVRCDKIGYNGTKLEVNLEGYKLGPSTGLLSDYRGGIYYFINRDYVLVRWDSLFPILAENHEVIMQSSTLTPTVQQIFMDTQTQVWLLLGHSINGTHCFHVLKPNYIGL